MKTAECTKYLGYHWIVSKTIAWLKGWNGSEIPRTEAQNGIPVI